MNNFKIGDKVECIDTQYISLKLHNIYEIVGIDNEYLLVNNDNFNYLVHESKFKLIEEHNSPKKDLSKPPLSWIPLVALEQEALVFLFGEQKHGRFAYKNGMPWRQLLDAALRHINQFADGQDLDVDNNCEGCKNKDCKVHSGKSHLAAARADLAMLMYMVDKKIGTDDR